jgi:molecular chaperone GrpE
MMHESRGQTVMTDDPIQADLQICRDALAAIEAHWEQAIAAFDAYRKRVDAEQDGERHAEREQIEAKYKAELEQYRQQIEAEQKADLDAYRQRIEAEQKADLDQYHARAERERERSRQQEREAVLRDWLEVLDNLERALMHRDRESLMHLWEGLVAVYRQAQGLLMRYEVTRIPTRGTHFDPVYHEAVGRVHGGPDGMIVQEIRPGYCIGETVLRPAQVIVAVQETPRRSPYGI